jgi:hypothetical protein
MAIKARELGVEGMLVPQENALEAAVAEGVKFSRQKPF